MCACTSTTRHQLALLRAAFHPPHTCLVALRLRSPMLQFPFAWADSAIFLNLPELGEVPLRLDACAVAGILEGNISNWNDPALRELNSEVSTPRCLLLATVLAAEWCGVKCHRFGAFAVPTRGVQGTSPAVLATHVLCAPTHRRLSCLTCLSPSSTSTSAHPSLRH